MLSAERRFAYRQYALMERSRPRQVALAANKVGKVTQAARRNRMRATKRLFEYRQRALVEASRLRQAALVIEHQGKVVEGHRRDDPRTERLFADG
jgi:hypothetical protein